MIFALCFFFPSTAMALVRSCAVAARWSLVRLPRVPLATALQWRCYAQVAAEKEPVVVFTCERSGFIRLMMVAAFSQVTLWLSAGERSQSSPPSAPLRVEESR